MDELKFFLSDSIMFWMVQALLLIVLLFLFGLDKVHQRRSGKGKVVFSITRSDKSMAIYYALYASVNGLLVALALSVEVAKDYKVIVSIFDTASCFYIFVLNQFMRNKIVQLTSNLTKVESR